jgi:ligand-binding SRPBCC domain-containing protein
MRPGAVIDYRLRLHGFPIRWQTEITSWEPPFRFVDEQRRGPYLLWIHEHRFEPLDGGTRVEDYVRYRPPGGWLVERLFVRRDVTRFCVPAAKASGTVRGQLDREIHGLSETAPDAANGPTRR